MKVYCLLFALLFLLCCRADAAFVVKTDFFSGNTSARHQARPALHHNEVLQQWKTAIADRLHWHASHHRGKNNSRGMISLLSIGAFLLLLTAVVIITPTIPEGLGSFLIIAGFCTSVLAIVFGILGIQHDRNRGYAIAGLILGCGVLFVETIMELFLLAVTGSLFL